MFTDGRLSISRDGMVLEEASPPSAAAAGPGPGPARHPGDGAMMDTDSGGGPRAGHAAGGISVIDVDLNGGVVAAGRAPPPQRRPRQQQQAPGRHPYAPGHFGGRGEAPTADDATMRPSSSDSGPMERDDGARARTARTRTDSFDMNSSSVRPRPRSRPRPRTPARARG